MFSFLSFQQQAGWASFVPRKSGESWASGLLRLKFNWYPAYRGCGARVIFVRDDYQQVTVALPLSWRTRNIRGSIFGGSMYAAVDPVLMTMYMMNLGERFSVWDKSAAISFLRPGRETLFAHCEIIGDEVAEIKKTLPPGEALEKEHEIQLVNDQGELYAVVEKVIHIRRRREEGSR